MWILLHNSLNLFRVPQISQCSGICIVYDLRIHLCVSVCTDHMMTNTEVAEAAKNIRRQSINQHPGHRDRGPGRHSLFAKTGSHGLDTNHRDHPAYHTFIPLPTLGNPCLRCMPDPEAEAARDYPRHMAILRKLIIRNLTGEQWHMLQVWQQSCGSGKCSWS